MATINIEDLTTINKDEAGVWTSATCGGIMQPLDDDITAGDVCTFPSGGIYQDDGGFGDCFECIGYSRTEVRTLKQGSTTVYVKCYVTFDENGGSSVSNRYVYFGTDGTNSRTYGEYASLPTPTKSGYTFDGWFESESSNNGTGTQVTNTTVVPSTIGLNKTLYAKWTANQTDAPSISAGIYMFNQWVIQVTNNDSSTATIYAEENDSTPDINRGSVASGSYVQVTSTQPSFATFTMYATAQASGETLSNVVSRTIT